MSARVPSRTDTGAKGRGVGGGRCGACDVESVLPESVQESMQESVQDLQRAGLTAADRSLI